VFAIYLLSRNEIDLAEETEQEYFLDPHKTQVSGTNKTRCPYVKT